MGDPCALDPASQARRSATQDRHARGGQRFVLPLALGLPVAAVAPRLSAQDHGLWLLCGLAARRLVGDDPAPLGADRARAFGTRGQPHCRDLGQPKRQGRAKGGSCTKPSGYDAGKKVKGVKRHAATDTNGLILALATTDAAATDRKGAQRLFKPLKRRFPFVRHAFVDGGYSGASFAALAKREAKLSIEVVSKPKDQQGFAVLPRRWVIERTFAWLDRRRRLNKHHESLFASATALGQMAMVETLLRRLARA